MKGRLPALLTVTAALAALALLVISAPDYLPRLGYPLDDAWIHAVYGRAIARDFSLSALASASITTFGLSVAGGAAAAAGAVSVWTFGTDPHDDYSDGSSSANALQPGGDDVRDEADATASGQGSHGYTSILDGVGTNTGSKADAHVGDAVTSASTLPEAEMCPAFWTAAVTSSMPAPQVLVVQ